MQEEHTPMLGKDNSNERKEIEKQVKEYTSNLQESTGLIPTSLQMQTSIGETVNVKLYPEVPVMETQPLQEDKTSQMAYLVLKNKISMDCYHEIATQFPSMPRSYKVVTPVVNYFFAGP